MIRELVAELRLAVEDEDEVCAVMEGMLEEETRVCIGVIGVVVDWRLWRPKRQRSAHQAWSTQGPRWVALTEKNDSFLARIVAVRCWCWYWYCCCCHVEGDGVVDGCDCILADGRLDPADGPPQVHTKEADDDER